MKLTVWKDNSWPNDKVIIDADPNKTYATLVSKANDPLLVLKKCKGRGMEVPMFPVGPAFLFSLADVFDKKTGECELLLNEETNMIGAVITLANTKKNK